MIWDPLLVSDHRSWKVGCGPGERVFQAGQGTNYTVKAQRQGIPGTFKEWKEVQLAEPGPQERKGG